MKVCLWSMPTDDLLLELRSANIEPAEVKQLTLRQPRFAGQTTYLLCFQRKQHMTVERLKQVRGLFNVIVDWRYYKNRTKEPTQCGTCLQFGHGKKSCFRPPVCFRCAGPHFGALCPFLKPSSNPNEKAKIDDELLRCALCKKKGHTAADLKCEARANYKAQQQAIRSRQQQQAIGSRNKTQKPNVNSMKEFPAMQPSTSSHLLSTHH